jgi:uncharacterized protein (TIGR00255 family)
MPRALSLREADIKKTVSSFTARGKVEVMIQLEQTADTGERIAADIPLARQIHRLLQELKNELPCEGDITLTELLAFKDTLFRQTDQEADPEKTWAALESALCDALDLMRLMQHTEGRETAADITNRINTIEELVLRIEQQAPQSFAQRKQAFTERIRSLCDGVELDESRLVQEIALMADKSDITEELVRLKSHIKQFRQWTGTDDPIGRKLDFLIQEINRESNTIGAKVADSELSLCIVSIKNELEKIREQVQNIM